MWSERRWFGTCSPFVGLIKINKSDVNSEVSKVPARKNNFLKPQPVAWQPGSNGGPFVLTFYWRVLVEPLKEGLRANRVLQVPEPSNQTHHLNTCWFTKHTSQTMTASVPHAGCFHAND